MMKLELFKWLSSVDYEFYTLYRKKVASGTLN